MDHIHSKIVIKNNKLIPRKISKKIINFINFETKDYENQKDISLSKFISYDQLLNLRKKFQKFKKNNTNLKPRNLLVYEFIKRINSKINFNFDREKFKLVVPELSGIKMSLSSILLSNLNLIENHEIILKAEFFTSYKNLLDNCDFKKPKIIEIEKFYNLFLKIKRNNEILYITTPCCPDYSKKKIKDKYEFTFKSIGNDMGLVAERLAQNIKEIHSFFDKFKIRYKHIITIGDFEAFSLSNQKRLNLNENDFLKKITINQRKINRHFNNKNCFTKKTFCKIFGKKTIWKILTLNFYEKIKNFEFDGNLINEKKIIEILNSRIPLYRKWYGNLKKQDYKDILFKQASEYASMSYLIKKKYKNSIVIGADHFRMSEFYKLGSDIPIFYLKKNYIT